MTAPDLHAADFPHGTREGYDAGCRGSHCTGTTTVGMTCRDVRHRYVSDWGFRKAIDAGRSIAEIVADEQARAEAERLAARQAKARARTTKPRAPRPSREAGSRLVSPEEKARRKAVRTAATAARRAERAAARAVEVAERRAARAAERAAAAAKDPAKRSTRDLVRELHAEGLLDSEIAQKIGVHQSTVSAARNTMGLPRQERAVRRAGAGGWGAGRERKPHGTRAAYARGCHKHEDCPNHGTDLPTCAEATRASNRMYAARRRAAEPNDENQEGRA